MNTDLDIDDLWEKSGGDDLLKGKTFQKLFDFLENNHSTFELSDKNLRCIDEGTPGGLHMAGSGILNENAFKDLEGRTGGIYSHENCGAAVLYCANEGITSPSDDVGEQKAKALAEKLGVSYLGMIKAKDLQRPLNLHNARVIYYDGTGYFDPSKLEDLPKGFVISRQIISDLEYAKSELKIALNIALGTHGFGDKFSAKSPLYVIAVSNMEKTSIEEGLLLEEIQEVITEFEGVVLDSIVVRK